MAAEFGNISLQLQHLQRDHALQSLFHALDPVAVLSQNLNLINHNRLHLIPEDTGEEEEVNDYVFQRGPRYNAYAELRELRLRMKHSRELQGGEIKPLPTTTPPRKQVKFQNLAVTQNSNLPKDVKAQNFIDPPRGRSRKASSVVAQSVPDFSAALRKENRRPAPSFAAEITLTPPSAKTGTAGMMGSGWSAKGSKSVGAAEKRGGAVRKSCANMEELKGLSVTAANAICGGAEARRRRILGSRRF